MKVKKERVLISFDYALKRLLRHKANHEILEGFLTELLYRPIKIKSILESESNREEVDSKQNRVDLLAENDHGELIIIEVQYHHQIEFLHRMLFATAKSTAEHFDKGDEYSHIKKIYSVNIIYFPLGTGDDYIYHGTTNFIGIHTKSQLQLSAEQKKQFKKETIAELYPEYYLLNVENFDNVAKNTLDEWVYYLKNNVVKDSFTAKGMEKVRKHLDYEKLSPEEKRRYDKDRETAQDWKSAIKTAELEGESRGLKKGRAEKAKALAKERAEKEKAIAKERTEKAKAIAEKEKEIEELKRLLSKK
jgi:predicted transposase/invertase (TIGR01784 family)